MCTSCSVCLVFSVRCLYFILSLLPWLQIKKGSQIRSILYKLDRDHFQKNPTPWQKYRSSESQKPTTAFSETDVEEQTNTQNSSHKFDKSHVWGASLQVSNMTHKDTHTRHYTHCLTVSTAQTNALFPWLHQWVMRHEKPWEEAQLIWMYCVSPGRAGGTKPELTEVLSSAFK